MTDVSQQQGRLRPRDRRIAQWTRDYAPLPGIPDEFLEGGAPRPVWQKFFEAFAALAPADIQRRFDAADRHLHEAGVTYRAPGDTSARDWPLSHVPLLIDEVEWAEISAGVAQRAELHEQILRDIYGEGKLFAEGALPPAAILGSPDYLRAVRGIAPPGGKYLRLYAADLGRAPDGRWWVLGDRTQSPSGAGYALENRLVLSRAMPQLFKSMNVARFASFFEAFRDSLRDSAERDQPRIGLLTPGGFSETYFEHTTLARYLGFLLVEGDDLAVSGDRIHIRTVAGLKRLDVLLRRVDSNSLDPLELDASSTLGVPGLIDVLRRNGVVVANMPGAGVSESRALLGFLPSLARRLLGEDLKLPHTATWWCGQPSARDEVLARFDHVAIESAFAGIAGARPMIPAEMSTDAQAHLRQAIATRGVDYVGQEVVRLSTTPVWEQGRLAPRPFVLRVFAAATKNGWTVMPGGFCRIAGATDARAVSMGAGARAADVWVLSDSKVDTASLLPTSETVRIQRIAGWVPSRAADNLFWLGRYLERAEATLRLIRALAAGRGSGAVNPSLERIAKLLIACQSTSLTARSSLADIARNALQGEDRFGSALSLVKAAMRAAGSLRERLSPDAWHVVTEIAERLSVSADDDDSVIAAAETAIQQLASFSGLAQENMNRAAGWRFLQMGRRVERAMNMTRFARHFARDEADRDDLDTLLTLGDCQITYRSRYLVGPLREPVRDLIVLDPYNPRSTAFQVGALLDHIGHLPVLKESGLLERPKRLAIGLQSSLATMEAVHLDEGALFDIERDLMNLADAIGARYFPHGANAARPEKLSALA